MQLRLDNSPYSYFTNKLYDRNFFEHKLNNFLDTKEDLHKIFQSIQDLYSIHKNELSIFSEAQLEDAIISPILSLLGWSILPKEAKSVHGVNKTPDFSLFANDEEKKTYLHNNEEQRKTSADTTITFLEAKQYGKALDTKKTSAKENPYFQLLEYMLYFRKNFGFLCNGSEWWLLDNTKEKTNKPYIAANLEEIAYNNNFEAFCLFYILFAKETYISDEDKNISSKIRENDEQQRKLSEENLRNIIYGINGEVSLFEEVGKALFLADKENTKDNLSQQLNNVFENSLYFVFRILFVAHFEDRNWQLLEKHSHYAEISLRKIRNKLKECDTSAYTAWADLSRLFSILNEGDENLNIPLLNGGLFDKLKAPLLSKSKVMNNDLLKNILDMFFKINETQERDFQSLSIIHLGTIYEGLLEFEFRIAEETLFYIEFKEKEKNAWENKEGYFDTYDHSQLKKKAEKNNVKILSERVLASDTFYLVSNQNSRKTAASYYTPQSLSFPLVQRAIDHQLKHRSILEIRILDNACGSGHILVEALNYLTQKAIANIDTDVELRAILSDEKHKIDLVLKDIGIEEVDEFAVLKRILLKRNIYGVDIQPFAIELAHLGLWIETFIFGTPLSLIEHHVKVGNALIGTNTKKVGTLLADRTYTIFALDIQSKFKNLIKLCLKLNTLQDTTADDIRESKKIYYEEIAPALVKLNIIYNYYNTIEIAKIENKPTLSNVSKFAQDCPKLIDDCKDDNISELRLTIQKYANFYNFFNWEVEFPEVFLNIGDRGFSIILGNPPWDKTKFEEPLFFSQYRSNYRQLKNSEKQELQINLLAKDYIQNKYEKEKQYIYVTNEYYKTHYPLNAGAGDGNLYRFFVERNLKLLSKNGTLNYVLPTALMTEDGASNLRRYILEKKRINYFNGFENREAIFPDIDSRYKFGLIQIENIVDQNPIMQTRFMLTNPSVLHNNENLCEYTLDDIRVTSPQHFAFMEVARGRQDLDIIKRIYALFEPLSPQYIDFRRELDATNDKSIFKEVHKPNYIPLYKGASIWQYNSKYAEPEYWLDPQEFDKHLLGTEVNRLISEVFPQLQNVNSKLTKEKVVINALRLQSKKQLEQFVVPDRNYFRLGFRAIARDTDERTLIATIVPKNVGAQNSLWLSIPKEYVFNFQTQKMEIKQKSINSLLFLQAIINSLIMDWIFRFSVAINVNKTYLMRQPVPQPSDEELATQPIYKELVQNSALLSLCHNKEAFKEIQDELKIADNEIPKTPKAIHTLQARNDVLVAGLYGISKTEMAYILESFKVLNDKKPEYVQLLLSMM